jgi:hypothetical protein
MTLPPDTVEHGLVVRQKPGFGSWRTGLPTTLCLLPVMVASALKLHGVGLIAALLAEVAVAAVGAALIQLGRKRLRFTLDDNKLIFTGRLTEREVFAEHRPGRVVELGVVWWGGAGNPLPLWTLVNADGECEVVVNARAFDPADLDLLQRQLGLECEVIEQPMKVRDARDAYPGVMPWWLVHIYAVFAAVFVIVVVVLLVA